ncbi:MAG: DMT family transporter [Acidimicrobiales bacterium]|jgi:transporter family-2 protein|nr:DMT family transporter [Acidimicrobiales bacterium]HLV90950.1 DMT family transporter [Acidimicrobiia bacterium]
MSTAIVVLFGLLGGLAGALQSQFLGTMEDKVGTLPSTFITYGLGGAAVGLVMVAVGGDKWSELRGMPWWVYTAGLLGLVVIATLGITVSRLGLGAGMVLFTSSNLVIAAVIDHFGWLSESSQTLDVRRAAGIGLVVLGTWLVVGGTDAAATG